MEFCDKCGSIMMPSKDESGKMIFKCKCGNVKAIGSSKMTEKIKEEKSVEVIDESETNMPVIKEKCPKCGNGEANSWTQQMRAGDEPETEFYRCTKCKHTWRDQG